MQKIQGVLFRNTVYDVRMTHCGFFSIGYSCIHVTAATPGI